MITSSRRARRWIRRRLLGYEWEICHACGRPVGLVWTSPDALWLEIVGRPGGILCIPCFDGLCQAEGLSLRWVPQPL